MKLEVESEFLNGIYKDLANLVGEENARHIYEEYRGQQITFPVEFYNKQYIYGKIIAEFDGTNLKQLATKYGYSERTVRRILKESI
ncbi:MAG: Mor transcription activator family protein [Clostridia bacterium]|nr:Mor transcription activator family protein [Clostridia bacterium]